MAVPDTDTFTLQNVVNDLVPSTNDLVECFAIANAVLFDPAYEGSKNELLNFRNYGVGIIGPRLGPSQGSALNSCSVTTSWETKYVVATNFDSLVIGDTFYNEPGGTTIFNGGNNWYANYSSAAKEALQISAVGKIVAITVC